LVVRNHGLVEEVVSGARWSSSEHGEGGPRSMEKVVTGAWRGWSPVPELGGRGRCMVDEVAIEQA
jgi:hypothetical protein